MATLQTSNFLYSSVYAPKHSQKRSIMAPLQTSNFLYSSVYAPKHSQKRSIMATLDIPKPRTSDLSISNLPAAANGLVEELELNRGCSTNFKCSSVTEKPAADSMVIEKLYAILEAIADRVEMHKNIGEQRVNWNSLLLTSINAITLTAATMTGIAAANVVDSTNLTPLNLSSTLLYLAATGMLIIVNKIQPSQLVEEQRSATRFFQQLQNQIQRIITIGNPGEEDVEEAMMKILALDRAYPLPLLGVMLEKFPSTVEPAVWWPQQRRRSANQKKNLNGWNGKLEEEMREIIRIIRRNDKADYIRLGGKALKLSKVLAISGPLLTGVAALGSAFVGSPSHGSWAAMLGVVAGALSSVVNSFEHGGQVGMLFEMYRSNAGFFRLMEESIESNLIEEEVERRESGELLEMKVALQLGRSLSELRDLATSSSSSRQGDHNIKEEFASKLF